MIESQLACALECQSERHARECWSADAKGMRGARLGVGDAASLHERLEVGDAFLAQRLVAAQVEPRQLGHVAQELGELHALVRLHEGGPREDEEGGRLGRVRLEGGAKGG